MGAEPEVPYVSRGGTKLAAALDRFEVDPSGMVCADLGSSAGGFVDCLLRRGAAKVYAIDTAYGQLAYKLRNDERVVVMERTNALHAELPEPVSLVTVDVGWTRQHLILPVAQRMLGPGGRIITLIKPHYEADKRLLRSGVLPDDRLESVVQQVVYGLRDLELKAAELMESPIRGQGGNREVFALVQQL